MLTEIVDKMLIIIVYKEKNIARALRVSNETFQWFFIAVLIIASYQNSNSNSKFQCIAGELYLFISFRFI